MKSLEVGNQMILKSDIFNLNNYKILRVYNKLNGKKVICIWDNGQALRRS